MKPPSSRVLMPGITTTAKANSNKPSGEVGKAETWWVPISGAAPRQLARYVNVPSVHPDGTRIAFEVVSAEPRQFEIWAMENVLMATRK